MAGVPREVLKWIQSLDLKTQMKHPKWDMSNGYMLAEMFSWYYPTEIDMHMYNFGDGLVEKMKNWNLLKQFIKKRKLDIPSDLIEGTIHCKEGAAQLLLNRVYETLTNTGLQAPPNDALSEIDFTDKAYQAKLPMHARNTAIASINSNIRSTEIKAHPDVLIGQYKNQSIILRSMENRKQERIENPARFNIRSTLAERVLRAAPPPPSVAMSTTESGELAEAPVLGDATNNNKNRNQSNSLPPSRQTSDSLEEDCSIVQFNSERCSVASEQLTPISQYKEVQVNQMPPSQQSINCS